MQLSRTFERLLAAGARPLVFRRSGAARRPPAVGATAIPFPNYGIPYWPWGVNYTPVPEHPPAITTTPGLPPPVSIVPGVPGGCTPPQLYPPNCSPCPPQADPMAMMAYSLQCYERQAQVQRAAEREVLANQEQIPLGIESDAVITAGSTETLEASPDVPMCITRFVVDESIRNYFRLGSMKTARVELLASGTFVSASSFAHDALVVPKLKMVTVYPGTTIYLEVKNTDVGSHFFYGEWWGIPGEQPGSCLG